MYFVLYTSSIAVYATQRTCLSHQNFACLPVPLHYTFSCCIYWFWLGSPYNKTVLLSNQFIQVLKGIVASKRCPIFLCCRFQFRELLGVAKIRANCTSICHLLAWNGIETATFLTVFTTKLEFISFTECTKIYTLILLFTFLFWQICEA